MTNKEAIIELRDLISDENTDRENEALVLAIEKLRDKRPTVEITETEIQKVLNKMCMTVVTNEYLIALHSNYLEGYKKGLDDGKDILKKEIKERLEEKKRRREENDQI